MKAFFALVILMTSVVASAQSRRTEGRIVLRDGLSTVRISVNENDRSDNMHMRVRLLEEAVRDLQNQVFDLRDSRPETRIVTRHVCSMITTFDGTFVGRASTKLEAEAVVRQNCQKASVHFCSSNRVNCEVVQEEVVIQ